MMRLARAAGLQVPPAYTLQVPEPVYLVERFDRTVSKGLTLRQHAFDGCQLLTLARTFKYNQCNPDELLRIVDKCRSKAMTRRRLFSWYLFNLLIGNMDNHLKNLSFFMSPTGIELAPHYDLVSTAIYEKDNKWLDAQLVWKFGAVQYLHQVNKEYLNLVGEVLKVSPRLQNSILVEMVGAISREFEVLYAVIEQTNYPDNSKGSDLHLLRQIHFGIFQDMCKQLQV